MTMRMRRTGENGAPRWRVTLFEGDKLRRARRDSPYSRTVSRALVIDLARNLAFRA